MSRLVVVSNRVPLPDKHGNPPPGGLAVAVHAALRDQGGIWMGWSGRAVADTEDVRVTVREQGRIAYSLMDLTETDVEEYYNGFANRVLWPIFHGRVDLAEYARREMAGYFRVNRLFADQLVPMLRPDDTIWVHDYHLIPLAEELRQRGVKNRIGFFLHIPWPPADILFAMPVYEAVLSGLSAYDLVGFQTDYDMDNFIGCLQREGSGSLLGDGEAVAYGRQFRVGAFPIGMETEEFANLSRASVGKPGVRDLLRSLHGRRLIIGVDRLDYSKGIPNRIDAYERFLKRHPDFRGEVTFLQVTPKSRSDVPEYRTMQEAVAAQAGRVNGDNGAVDWTPIRYINQSLKRPVLAGLYRVAQVGFVTPLKDGMNLVAKEYVAAQDPADPGVLVLSRFAGAAREMVEALLINPYDIDATANALARALSMPLEERTERWSAMMDRLRAYDVHHWCRDYLGTLAKVERPSGAALPQDAPETANPA
ncbi:trehalose-6-phosphate synthase [Haematobacter massiliensis]|uniref:Trehalose-6-phosphate synthase n=1 Tax=Haematobacter massiliensis TaxID=195105 RepID=A0A086Y8J5_9RHOB|nr:alpha,alpha-trehalose-phosphate synthase (UDP-forming) [Haematobacter massiliensis]KFI30595.1 alpha,alpha-trehalose-phosphate synthase [Haematobacter massiliensis]OWJ71483.1 trehalose-6-phosphate synthase [Haematobacter massiliensis]OWJ87216.1 trehalose-6-phosphate synthase [Haematobacter massiliensis]QBJ25062.1 alpha,alpha-trehalose-phosphate synthase (UDP-forming) [Haematobacter massiliensis]